MSMGALPATASPGLAGLGGGELGLAAEGGGRPGDVLSLAGLLPSERMCHSLTAMGGERLLLVGGRQREGICKEAWWLSMVRGGRGGRCIFPSTCTAGRQGMDYHDECGLP